MKLTHTFVTLLAAGLCSLPAGALAQSAKELEELRNELKALRAELNQLKAQQAQAPAASASAWNDRIDAVELKQKDAVVLGDIPGSFRLPGSETSIRVYGFAEANLIKDFKGTAPGDNFSNLMEQPLGSTDQGKTVLTGQTSRFGSKPPPRWATARSTPRSRPTSTVTAAPSATATACACAMPTANTRAG